MQNYLALPPNGELHASRLFDMTGRVCIITGGGTGIGAMIAAGFVENGAKVYIVSRSDISAYANFLTQRGPGKCIALSADISVIHQIDGFVSRIKSMEPAGMDVLVNNAGTMKEQRLSQVTLKDWDDTYNLNVRGLFYMTQQLVPLLEKKGAHGKPSSIINISSVDAMRAPHYPTYAYSSGKAAVIQLTRHLAAHLYVKNINVNCISPGLFPSKLTEQFFTIVGEEKLAEGIPMGRVGGSKDAASTALLLASQAGSWITGINIPLDGGYKLRVTKEEARSSL